MRSIFHFLKSQLFIIAVAGITFAGLKGSGYLSSVKKDLPKRNIQAQYYDKLPYFSQWEDYIPIDILSRPHQLLQRHSYIVSYNKETKCPNWVFWELTREHADGDVERPDYAFHEDMEVPTPRAELSDYHGCGLDRGHMCPAGDNKWNRDAMYETFLMTNMCPQNQQLNSGLWNQIEIQCRYWAKKYGRLYIVCGPIYFNSDHQTIGANMVVVPEAFFKVVLCLEGTPKGIAFVCKNTDGIKKKDYYVNTISQMERITGYNFFPHLASGISERVKDIANLKEW